MAFFPSEHTLVIILRAQSLHCVNYGHSKSQKEGLSRTCPLVSKLSIT